MKMPAEIVTHETLTAEPGEFVAYFKTREAKPEVSAPVEAAETPEPATQDAAKPVEADAFDDPETHDRIEKPTRADKRIKRLWQEREEARKRADSLAAQLAALTDKTAAREPAAPARAEVAASSTAAPEDALTAAAQARIRSKPNRADIGTTYATYEDYVEDCAIWGGELAAEKRQIIHDQQQATAAGRERQRALDEAAAIAKQEYDDFDQVTTGEIPVNDAIRSELQELPADEAIHVFYYLATHRDEAQKIAKLSPGKSLLALGEVVATVRASRANRAKPAPVETPTTKAPKPLTPVQSRAASITRAADIAATGGNPVDFILARNQETARRL